VGEMIIKELKHAIFEYDNDDKKLVIAEREGDDIALNGTEMFSLMRFIIRIAQKGQRRKRK
jgi:hypothetical protein